MIVNLSKDLRRIIMALFFLIIPLVLILAGVIASLTNGLYYILSIFWFGMGIVFYAAIQ